MLECYAVLEKAANRIHHFVDEEHAMRLATHLDVHYDLVTVTDVSSMRSLGSPDHAAEAESLLAKLGA